MAVTIRNEEKEYDSIKIFTPYDKLNDIIKSVLKKSNDLFLDAIVSPRGCYRTTKKFFEDFPEASSRLGKGTGNMIASNFFEKIPESYITTKTNDCYGILSRINNRRTICYIKKIYVQYNDFIEKYNLAFPKSNGNGIFGETLTSPEILKPFEGASDTFINIGKLETASEAENLKKYICSKFSRTMLGVKKATQDNPKNVWSLVPLQDFTSNSDIDWSKSVHEIDLQLYKKYGLSDDEINFIETHVKEME